MSKNIFDEALEKIKIEFDAWERSEKIEVIEIIEEALEQAQKQEKLLGQYKKVASAIVRTSIEQPIYVIRISEREMVEQSFNRIKELENDSKRNV